MQNSEGVVRVLNKILPAVLAITVIFAVASTPALSNGTEAGEDWKDHLEPVTSELELEADDQVLNLPIQKLDGEHYIDLKMLAYLFDWTVETETDQKMITIENSDGLKSAEFEVGTREFNGHELTRPPVKTDDLIYIGPDLTRYLAADLEDQDINFIAWLELVEEDRQAEGMLYYNIDLWNIAERPLTLNFMSGQTIELYLLKEGSLEWKLSDDRAYTMAISDIELESDEVRNWNEKAELPAEISGDYILTGEITTQSSLPLNQIEISFE